jgi:hypothetical protein
MELTSEARADYSAPGDTSGARIQLRTLTPDSPAISSRTHGRPIALDHAVYIIGRDLLLSDASSTVGALIPSLSTRYPSRLKTVAFPSRVP